jgi:excisionase family DNA binding protein
VSNGWSDDAENYSKDRETLTAVVDGRRCGMTPDTSIAYLLNLIAGWLADAVADRLDAKQDRPAERESSVPRLALSMDETGEAIGVCSKTVAKLISDGRLRCVMVGTRRLVPVSETQRWLDIETGR